LGVDADEMGFAAPAARHPSGRANWSAVLFDRASGGAGFAATLARDPVTLLGAAREFLDCERTGRCGDPEAVRACPRCVLGPDAQHAGDLTDRRSAFDLLTTVIASLRLPAEHRLFGDETAYEPAPLAITVVSRSNAERRSVRSPACCASYEPAPLAIALGERMTAMPQAELVVRLGGDPQAWELDHWPSTPLLERWGARGRRVHVEVPRQALMQADPVTRRSVALWAQRARVRMVELADDRGRTPDLLAAILDGSSNLVWGSSDPAATEVGTAWAATSAAPVVRGSLAGFPPLGVEVDPHDLLRERAREAIFEIEAELDGPVEGFGARLKGMLVARSRALAEAFALPCLELRYSDRYLFSPLTVRLAAEMLAGFADAGTSVEVATLAARKQGRAKNGRKISDDWADMAARDFVLRHLLTRISPTARLDTRDGGLPHRRRLDFRTASGSGTIFFDQGVGSWRTEGTFDPLAPEGEQLAAVSRPFLVVNGPAGTFAAARLS
jgi:DEAD/DEAH box helicase domain-containing protein